MSAASMPRRSLAESMHLRAHMHEELRQQAEDDLQANMHLREPPMNRATGA